MLYDAPMTKTARYLLNAGTALGFAGILTAPYIAAAPYGFDPVLGGHLADVLPFPLYPPQSPYIWARQAEWIPGSLFASIVTSAGSLALALGCSLASTTFKNKRKPEEFGSDGWGTLDGARSIGLVEESNPGPESIVLARLGNRFICINDNRNGLVTGPARSGKTTTALITTGLAWRGSMLFYTSGAMDVYNATSGWRSTFSDIYVLDLGRVISCYNPLDSVRIGTHNEVTDAEIIASAFPPEPASKARMPWWPIQGTRVLAAAILHIMYTQPPGRRNLGSVYKFLHQSDKKVIEAFSTSKHSYVRETAYGIPEGDNNPIITAKSYLRPWSNPVLDQVTSKSDFTPSSLVTKERPATVYIHIPEDQREYLLPVLQVFVTCITKALMFSETHMRDGKEKRHKVVLGLDEFHTFYVEGFDATLALMPKYGVRALLLTQSVKSLTELYGRNQTVSTNCQVQFRLPTNDKDEAEEVSMMVGEFTEIRHTEARSGKIFDILWSGKQRSEQEVRRRIIDPGAVRSMERGTGVLLSTSSLAFKAKTLWDYEKRFPFSERILPPYEPEASDLIERPKQYVMGDF